LDSTAYCHRHAVAQCGSGWDGRLDRTTWRHLATIERKAASLGLIRQIPVRVQLVH